MTIKLKHQVLAALLAVFLPVFGALGATNGDAPDDPPVGDSAVILSKYLQANQTHEDVLRGASMEVDINASIPKRKEHGRLRALRKISKVGQITYHVLGFQGSSFIKSQVIARYLQAEQEGQGDQSLAITPANYKFKYKGQRATDTGKDVYVFQLSPVKKKVGLFKGEMWLDSNTCLPVFEKGRFVKNPSIFFRRVDFERAFAIRNGVPVPAYMTSTIDTRLVGKVELNISYSNFAQNTEAEDGQDVSSESSAALPEPSCK